MYEPCSFSSSTKEYLSVFYDILDHMIQGMEGACLTDSISQNFIVQMIPHHRAAIQMSENVLKYTTCDALQQIASNIIAEQTKGIREMQYTVFLQDAEKLLSGHQSVPTGAPKYHSHDVHRHEHRLFH